MHSVLDIPFHEDASRIRRDNAPENMALLRYFALNLLKRVDTPRAKARGFLIQRDNLPDRLASTWQRSDSSKGVEISVCPTVFFNPIASIFSAAFKSLSNTQPHLQIWVRVLRVFLTNVPQLEQFWLV